MKKNGTQKSHATPPLNGLIDAGDDIDDVVVVYTTLPHLAMSNPRYLSIENIRFWAFGRKKFKIRYLFATISHFYK